MKNLAIRISSIEDVVNNIKMMSFERYESLIIKEYKKSVSFDDDYKKVKWLIIYSVAFSLNRLSSYNNLIMENIKFHTNSPDERFIKVKSYNHFLRMKKLKRINENIR